MFRKILLLLLLNGNVLIIQAQTMTTALIAASGKPTGKYNSKLSLQDCIEIAWENNLQIKQSQLQLETGIVNLNQAKANRLPTINATVNQGFNSGRSIDPYTNAFVDQQITSNNFGVNSSITLFSGYQLQNSIRQNQLNLEAARLDIHASRDQIALNITLAFLQVLSNQDLLDVSLTQRELTNIQIVKAEQLVQNGIIPYKNVLDLKAQLSDDELNVVNAGINLKSARLSLSQLMNLTDNEAFLLERMEGEETASAGQDMISKDIYSLAKEIRPEVKAAEMRIKSAEISREIARGSKYPVITLNLGLGTQYSSAAPGERFVKDGSVTYIEKPSDDAYVLTNGVKSPVYIKQAIEGGEMQKFRYFDQLGTNFNRGIVLNIKIPIFNGYSAKNRIAKSVIEKKQAECQAENVKQQLRQNIEQAYNNYNASIQKLSALENQVKSLEEAFRVAEYSFNLGKVSSVDYNVAKTQLDKARYNRIQAKYEKVFRLKILNFYQNKNTDF